MERNEQQLRSARELGAEIIKGVRQIQLNNNQIGNGSHVRTKAELQLDIARFRQQAMEKLVQFNVQSSEPENEESNEGSDFDNGSDSSLNDEIELPIRAANSDHESFTTSSSLKQSQANDQDTERIVIFDDNSSSDSDVQLCEPPPQSRVHTDSVASSFLGATIPKKDRNLCSLNSNPIRVKKHLSTHNRVPPTHFHRQSLPHSKIQAPYLLRHRNKPIINAFHSEHANYPEKNSQNQHILTKHRSINLERKRKSAPPKNSARRSRKIDATFVSTEELASRVGDAYQAPLPDRFELKSYCDHDEASKRGGVPITNAEAELAPITGANLERLLAFNPVIKEEFDMLRRSNQKFAAENVELHAVLKRLQRDYDLIVAERLNASQNICPNRKIENDQAAASSS